MNNEEKNFEKIIKNSFNEVKVSKDYTERLLNKLYADHSPSIHLGKNISSGLSFIFAGILMLVIYNTDIMSEILDIQLQLKLKTNIIQSNYKENFIKDNFGEDIK
ncbi:hypothetical protein JOC70_002531 [Clostridium pascui]|uniref:hypothetical protein n=1 Tax=Clostridium pascui TaxID=46609 RepID=UPI00195C3957|nr:hypothetical protein [Clostridium pascui]MBM7871037.1 hypothetical protein [Clostridium pascui]